MRDEAQRISEGSEFQRTGVTGLLVKKQLWKWVFDLCVYHGRTGRTTYNSQYGYQLKHLRLLLMYFYRDNDEFEQNPG